MDSGNSGSLNSSSGGDEEYDSRAAADSFSAFFSSGNTTGSATLAQPTPSYQPTTPFYDTLSFLDSNPSALANLDLPWSRTSLNPSPPPPNPNPNPNPSMFPSSSTPYSSTINTTVNPPQPPAPPPAAPPRNSKKRSRASRRAPTTVLTTDTSNFRAMVQEFTGIPAPPFASSSSSPFHRSCFDLLHSPALRSAAAEQPPYILRPFAHKLHPSAGSNVNAGAARPGTQLPPPDLSIANQNQALLNIQQNNPMLSLQSLLQSPLNPKYNYGPKSQAPVSYAAAGEMGLSNLIRTSETMQSNWAPAADDQPQFRPVGCFGDSQRGGSGSGCKMNFSSTGPGPAQDFRADKQGENLPAGPRGEATVESWICSSD